MADLHYDLYTDPSKNLYYKVKGQWTAYGSSALYNNQQLYRAYADDANEVVYEDHGKWYKITGSPLASTPLITTHRQPEPYPLVTDKLGAATKAFVVGDYEAITLA